MNDRELARILRCMYDSGDGLGLQKTMIHLFGIKYACEIEACDTLPEELCRMAGMSKHYGTEVRNGCRLAPFVEITPGRL